MAEYKYTKTVLNKMTKGDLENLWTNEEGRDISDFDDDYVKATLIEALLEIEVEEDELDEELEEEIEEEPELDEEEEIEADEVDEPAPTPTKKKAAAKTEAGENTLAAKQVATMLGTEAKTLRQFFRSSASTVQAVGSGGRYEFNESDIPKIKQEFEAWKAGHGSRGAKRTGEGSTRSRSRSKIAEVTEVEEVEELEIEELEDAELDDEELELEDED